MRVLSHGGTANASQSHGSRKIPFESSFRLPDHTNNVRPKNSTVTPSHATSQRKLWRASSEIGNPQIRPDGRSAKQRFARNPLSAEKPRIGTISRTGKGAAPRSSLLQQPSFEPGTTRHPTPTRKFLTPP